MIRIETVDYTEWAEYNKGYDCKIRIQYRNFIFENSPYYIQYEGGDVVLHTPMIEYTIEEYKRKWNNVWFEYEKHNEKYMYIIVCFQGHDGKVHRNYLHRLVAATFCNVKYHIAVRKYGKDCELVVDHIDGNTLNNRPDNLRYIPRTMNYEKQDAFTNEDDLYEIPFIISENQDKEWLKNKK